MGLVVSEGMSFENVDRRTADAWLPVRLGSGELKTESWMESRYSGDHIARVHIYAHNSR